MDKLALVAGSAHLDILASVVGDPIPVDKIGEVRIEVGGTAANVAMAMVAQGVGVRFLTAMNRSPYSQIVTQHLAEQGMDLMVDYQDDLPMAAFCAHIDERGELESAISSMPVDRHVFSPRMIATAMEGVQCAVLDCNLAAANLDLLTQEANRRLIPVFVAAVSEEKALRVAKLSGKVDVLFLNHRELAYLRAHAFPEAETAVDIATSMGCNLVVTRGPEGADLIRETGTVMHIPAPKPLRGFGNTLGSGDAFLAAAVVEHVFEGRPLYEALMRAREVVAKVLAAEHCNLGRPGSVERTLAALSRRSMTDAVTGLANAWAIRKALDVRVRQALGRGRKLAVLVLDVDDFKSINDRYGHEIGDAVLKQVGRVLAGTVRSGDVAGRWGGEEFVCVIRDADLEAGRVIAERIRDQIKRRTVPPVTVSVGVAVLEAGDTADTLFARADGAMYTAKRSGKDRVCLASMENQGCEAGA